MAVQEPAQYLVGSINRRRLQWLEGNRRRLKGN